jgi:hypothetical protein
MVVAGQLWIRDWVVEVSCARFLVAYTVLIQSIALVGAQFGPSLI